MSEQHHHHYHEPPPKPKPVLFALTEFFAALFFLPFALALLAGLVWLWLAATHALFFGG
jgi:hypothetical protein